MSADAQPSLSTDPRPQPPGAVPVAFVKYYDKGSTEMGAHQIAAGLAERGWPARPIYGRETGRCRREVLVFIKTSRLDHLLVAKARGNRLVLDVQDTVVFKGRIKNRWLFDALIFKNRRQLADFGRAGRLDRIVYHQWDPRYAPHQAVAGRLTAGYLGDRRSLDLWDQLPGVECVDDQFFSAARRFNCHLSLRRPGREMRYKPNCKVSTAAACDANLVTTRDASSVELLGEDYPYFCGHEREAVLATLERARADLDAEPWQRGLARMRAVRELTCIDRVLDGYEQLLHALTGGAPARR